MKLAAGGSVLDEAYERLFGFGPEFDGWLSNHGPMVVEVFERHGRSAATHAWLDGYTKRLEPAPAPRWPITSDDWREAIGDSIRLGDWLGYFECELRERPWPDVLLEWWPRLAPGAVASATHGLIRTGHAVRSLRQGETAPRVRELGAALGYWAARFQRLPAASRPAGDLSAEDALARLPRIEDPAGGARTRTAQLTESSPWPDGLAALRPPASPQDVPAALDSLVDAAVSQYLDFGASEPIMLVHAATAPAAAAASLDSLPTDLWQLTWREAWTASAAITACYAIDRTHEPDRRPALTADEVLGRAIENGDEHLVKFTDVALLVHERGCSAALPAASLAVSLFE